MFASRYGSGAECGGRRRFVLGALLFLTLLAACGGDEKQLAGQALSLSERNLLLLTIDTLRADRLGAYGYKAASTPRLDRLARDGVLFRQAYTSVPLTLPSHATILTGKYPFVLGVRNNGSYFLGEDETTLAELFHARGFTTWATIASYVLAAKFGLAQGFDSYDDALGDDRLLRTFTSDIPADEVSRRFIRALDSVSGEKRFFAWAHFYDPHQPYSPPGELAERFASEPYDGEVAWADQHVGKILDELDRRGYLASTLVVVASDHGEGFGEHGEHGHGIFCYEESLRVPLIFYAQGGLPAGRVVEDRVRLVDLLPTLGELFSLETPAGLDGWSFAGLLIGDAPPDPAPRTVYFESLLGQEDKNWAPLTGLLDGAWKYIALPSPELYRLSDDPHEELNLFPAERAETRRLDASLRELLLSRPAKDGSRRELDSTDEAQLRSLGYLSGEAARAGDHLDPKDGIEIENGIRDVRTDLEAGRVDQAAVRLAALQGAHPSVLMPEIYDVKHDLAVARADDETAVKALQEGMEHFPDLEQFPLKLAAYSLAKDRLDLAEELSHELLSQNPRASQASILLARIAERRGDLPTALLRYREALTLEPRSIPLRKAFAEALVKAGDMQQALAVCRELVESGALDQDAQELYKIAMLNSRFGDQAVAEKLFRRGLELAPGGVHYLSFAFILAAGGRQSEAIPYLERALGEYAAELSPEQRQLARRALDEWRSAPGRP